MNKHRENRENTQNQPDYLLLEKYLDKSLSAEENNRVEKYISGNRAWFEALLELKEARFLLKSGIRPSPALADKIMSRVETEKAGFVRIFIRMVNGAIMISSGNQENMDFQAIGAQFSFRGENKQGPVSITREIKGNEVTVILNPSGDNSFFSLSLKIKSKHKYDIALFLGDVLAQRLSDIKKSALFSPPVPASGSCELVFYEKDNEAFRISLVLEGEQVG